MCVAWWGSVLVVAAVVAVVLLHVGGQDPISVMLKVSSVADSLMVDGCL